MRAPSIGWRRAGATAWRTCRACPELLSGEGRRGRTARRLVLPNNTKR
jgi:hypothetical protein